MGMLKWWNGSEWVRRVMKYNSSGWVAREVRYPPAVYDGSTVAWYDYKVGVTKDGSNYVSSWADKLGSGHDLLQATGTYQPLWSTDGILFDGVDNYMKTVAFTWNQPCQIYMVLKQVTWTSDDFIFDGNADLYGSLIQYTASPQIWARVDAGLFSDSNLVTDTFGIVKVLFNGSSSKIQVDNNIASTGTCGTTAMGGFTLGRPGTNYTQFGNIQVKEIICRNVADTEQDEEEIYQYLFDKYFPVRDGNTVAWFDAQDLKNIQKDGSNYVSVWGDRSQGGVSNLGAELVVNGGFSADSDWVKESEWTIGSGVASYDATGTIKSIKQNITLVVGKVYKIQFTIVSGTARLSIDSYAGSIMFAQGEYLNNYAVGTHVIFGTATDTGGISIYAYNTSGGTAFTIDNISVKEIPGNHLVQATGTNQPLWSADGITFDGVDNFLKTAAFTLNQPTMVYLVLKQVTWTVQDRIFDGNITNALGLVQASSSPDILLYSSQGGDSGFGNTTLALDTYSIIRIKANTSDSSIQVNALTKSTGSLNSGAYLGGITLGSEGSTGTNYSNIIVKEVIFRNVADNAADEQKIYNYLEKKYFRPATLYDGHTVAWYDSQDTGTIVKDGSNAVSLWMNRLQAESPELCVNGGFAADSDWAKGDGWTISDGKLNANTSGYTTTYQTNVLVVGKTYIVKYTVSNLSSGYVRINLGQTSGTSRGADGTYTEVLTCTVDAILYIQDLDPFIGSVDNVSVKEVTGQHLLQLTGTNQPTWSTDGITFDGVDNFMKTAAFTLNQPTMVYLVLKQVTFTVNDYIMDGVNVNGGVLQQVTESPKILAYAGGVITTYDLTLNTLCIVRVLYNGANSKLQINDNAAATGDIGSNTMGGVTFGSISSADNYFSNIQVKEAIFRNVSDNDSDEAKIYAYLSAKYSIT